MTEPKQYLVAHLQRALAGDPRVHELDVRVKVVGDKILLTGAVETAGRRHAIQEVVSEAIDRGVDDAELDRPLEILNEVTVMDYAGQPGEEHLS